MSAKTPWYKKLHWLILLGMLIGIAIGGVMNVYDHSHSGEISAITPVRGSKVVFSAGRDGALKQWMVDGDRLVWSQSVRGHKGEIRALAGFAATVVAYVDSGNTITIRDAYLKEKPRRFSGGKSAVMVLAGVLHNRQRLLFTGHANGEIRRWALNGTNKPAMTRVKGHRSKVTALRISASGLRLFSGGADHRIRVWGIGTLQRVASFDAHSGSVTALADSPDGSKLVSGDSTGALLLWDLQKWQKINRYRGHKGAISGLYFKSDGRGFVSVGRDRYFAFWSLEYRQPQKRIKSSHALMAGLIRVKGDRLVTVGGKKKNLFVVLALPGKGRKGFTVTSSPEVPWLKLFDVIGTIFIRLLKMIIVPLVLTSLVVGISSLGDLKKLGRMGLKTLVYYMSTTALSVLAGLVLVNLIKPGVGVTPLMPAGPGLEPKPMIDILINIFPTNIFRSLASGDILPIIFFSLLLGTALTTIKEKGDSVRGFFQGAFDAVIKIVDWIMWLAPIGVLALLAKTVAEMGSDLFVTLGWYVITVVAGLAFHGVITLGLVLWLFAGMSPLTYAHQMSRALMTAFSTDSSSATLPVTMECVEDAGVSNRISSFVLPLGATVNMDGTALYEAVAAIFIAQVYGIDLSFSQQVIIFLTATLAAIGAAGVPSAGLVTMIIVLRAVGLPLEGIGILVGIDRILDMCRTTVNVWGDAVGARIIARSEGEYRDPALVPTGGE